LSLTISGVTRAKQVLKLFAFIASTAVAAVASETVSAVFTEVFSASKSVSLCRSGQNIVAQLQQIGGGHRAILHRNANGSLFLRLLFFSWLSE
jgi:hypothetical protein